MNFTKSPLIYFVAALVATVSIAAVAGGLPDKNIQEIGVDLSRPLELKVTIDIPSERTDKTELSNYLDRNGFKLSIDIRTSKIATEDHVDKITLTGIKSGKFTASQINEYSRVITRLSAKFKRRPIWTFKQNLSGS